MAVPRCWRDADGVAAMQDFFAIPPPRSAAIRGLMRELVSKCPFEQRCAADLARRVSAREPGILKKYGPTLIDLAADPDSGEWQTRGYLMLAAALNACTQAQRIRLSVPVRAMLSDERIALRAIAVEAFSILAAAEPELREEAMLLLERCRRNGTTAERLRARRMLLLLLSAEKSTSSGKDQSLGVNPIVCKVRRESDFLSILPPGRGN